MKRSGIQPRGGQAAEPTRTVRVELSAQVVETLTDVEHGLLGLCIEVGQQVLTQLMEEDRIALCGPKWQPDPARSAVRAGTTRSEVTLGGRRITIQRPRVRARTNTEIALPTFTAASARDPLNRQTLAAVVTGVATRRYARGLEPLPASLTERATSKSAVSRRFTVLSRRLLTQWLARSPGGGGAGGRPD
jgi:hypothetical protein